MYSTLLRTESGAERERKERVNEVRCASGSVRMETMGSLFRGTSKYVRLAGFVGAGMSCQRAVIFASMALGSTSPTITMP